MHLIIMHIFSAELPVTQIAVTVGGGGGGGGGCTCMHDNICDRPTCMGVRRL